MRVLQRSYKYRRQLIWIKALAAVSVDCFVVGFFKSRLFVLFARKKFNQDARKQRRTRNEISIALFVGGSKVTQILQLVALLRSLQFSCFGWFETQIETIFSRQIKVRAKIKTVSLLRFDERSKNGELEICWNSLCWYFVYYFVLRFEFGFFETRAALASFMWASLAEARAARNALKSNWFAKLRRQIVRS